MLHCLKQIILLLNFKSGCCSSIVLRLTLSIRKKFALFPSPVATASFIGARVVDRVVDRALFQTQLRIQLRTHELSELCDLVGELTDLAHGFA